MAFLHPVLFIDPAPIDETRVMEMERETLLRAEMYCSNLK